MAKYLERMLARVAEGASRLPEAFRKKHGGYVAEVQNADGGFSGREGPSDLYYTSFALRTLAVTGALEGEVATRSCDFLTAQLSQQTPVVDFLSLIFSAGLLQAWGHDPFAAVTNDWQASVAAQLNTLRREDGGFARSAEAGKGSTYHTFLVVLALELIDQPLDAADQVVTFLKSRQREDGGFVEVAPLERGGTNPTAAAVATLVHQGAMEEDARKAAVGFLASMQTDEGGLRANTRIPVADVLSTFTGLLTLAELEAMDSVDVEAARRFVESVEGGEGGFRGAAWDEAVDVEYTFYGVGAMALCAAAASTKLNESS